MTKFSGAKNEWLFIARIRNLPLAGKFYLSFNLVSLLLVLVTNLICFQSGANIQDYGVRIILSFLSIYFIILPLVIVMNSRYQQDRNVIGAIMPVLMAIVGVLISLYIRSQQLAEELSLLNYLAILLVILIVPLATSFLNRSLSIKPVKLYVSSLATIILSSLIAFVFLVL